jgi:voltage-gated potassium channel
VTVGWAAAGFVLVLGSGVVGLMLIEGWSALDAIWMIAITASTVGYGERAPLSDNGRVFMLGFMLLTIVYASGVSSRVARFFIDGGLRELLLVTRYVRELEKMQGHYVVVGYGRLGREIVADLLHHGAEVVVLDAEEVQTPPGVAVIVGDATHDEVLVAAGVDRAAGIAVATREDAVNVYVTLSARQLAPDAYVVTRLEEEAAQDKALRAGADAVLLPFHLAGARASQALLRPTSTTFMDHATLRQFDDLHIEDVRIPRGSTVQGTLADLDLRKKYGVTVLAVRHVGGDIITPAADELLAEGDVLVVVGRPDRVRSFCALVAGRKPH